MSLLESVTKMDRLFWSIDCFRLLWTARLRKKSLSCLTNCDEEAFSRFACTGVIMTNGRLSSFKWRHQLQTNSWVQAWFRKWFIRLKKKKTFPTLIWISKFLLCRKILKVRYDSRNKVRERASQNNVPGTDSNFLRSCKAPRKLAISVIPGGSSEEKKK